jgi:predicted phosphodiesterase
VSAASFAALGKLPADVRGSRDLDNPDIRLGVISDVHIRNAGDEKILLEVLRWYRNNRVDAVMVAGDVADYGLTWQMDAFMCAWRDVFPDGMIGGSKKVELIYVTGNHEYDIWQRIRETVYKGDAKLEPYVFVKNIKREWERLFGVEYADTFVRDVKGYKFFCSNFIGWNPEVNLEAVKNLFEREKTSLTKDRPFFYMRHLPVKGTCGYAPGKAEAMTRFCASYSNMVVITGHTHDSLADNRSFWRGDFTSVNAGTLQHVYLPKGSSERKIRNSPQGLLVRVWPDFVHFERRDFKNQCRLDPAWESVISKGKEG